MARRGRSSEKAPAGTLSLIDDAGVQRHVRLDLAGRMPLETFRPWRHPKPYRKRRSIVGRFWFSTTDMHVLFESHLEMHHLLQWDYDLAVAGVLGQPLRFNFDGWSHVPDFFVRLQDGRARVYDVKPADQAELDENQAIWCAAADACKAAGWEYEVVSEIDPVRLDNLMALSSARLPMHDPLGARDVLLHRCVEPHTIGDLLAEFEWPALVKPVLLHLLWRQVLVVDIDARRIDRDSIIALGEVLA